MDAAPTSVQLCVFAKYPEPGKCKTRLITSEFSAEQAADLQRAMTVRILTTCREYVVSAPIKNGLAATILVAFAGGTSAEMFRFFGQDDFDKLSFEPQVEGDLGSRMRHVVRQAWLGGSIAIALGTDCPSISPELIGAAIRRLDRHDVCIAPATDGGYVMLAVRCPDTFAAQEHLLDRLFSGIDWGTEHVLQQTLANLADERVEEATQRPEGRGELADDSRRFRVCLLPAQPDVDRPEDLEHWYKAIEEPKEAARRAHPDLSVIIPVYNVEPDLQRTIASAQNGAERERFQVIVVAAGSVRETLTVAGQCGVECLTLPAGRALQMNAAAEVSAGRNLLFLHADTLLPQRYFEWVDVTLQDPSTIAGAFRLAIDSPKKRMRFVERMVAARCRAWHLPYGDQALFMRRRDFDSLGGFPELPIMEDYAFVRELRRRGRLKLLDASVTTSDRRWRRLGVIRTTLVNQLMLAGFHAGVSPQRLARLYRGKPRK